MRSDPAHARGERPGAREAHPLPPYAVRRSARARRLRLTVSRDGDVVVVLPMRVPLAEADRLVRGHRAWVERHVERARRDHLELAARPGLEAGRVLVVAGEPLRVIVRPDAGDGLIHQIRGPTDPGGRVRRRGRVAQVGGRLVVDPGTDGRRVPDLLEAWLRERARAVLGERVAARAGEMGVRPTRLTVRDQRSRWGSASRSGSLSFSWRLVLAPPEVLDAVVVHELAHLVIRDHSRTFWALVGRHAPATPAARRWLRQHARELHAALE